MLTRTRIFISPFETPFLFSRNTYNKIFKHAILLLSHDLSRISWIKRKWEKNFIPATFQRSYRIVQHETRSSNLLPIDHRLQDYTQPSLTLLILNPFPHLSSLEIAAPIDLSGIGLIDGRRPSADPKINEVDGWGGLLRYLPDIRVFIRALRIHTRTRCPTFIRERATDSQKRDKLTTLARDLSLGVYVGRVTERAGQEWYALLILRLYHSFTRLRVVKGEIYTRR